MIEKGKISSLQLAILFYPTIIASSLLSVPNATTRHAKNDLWFSPILASLVGVLVVFVVWKLYTYYPKQTVIQYSEKILGKFLGKVFGGLLIFTLLFSNGLATRQYGDLMIGAFLPLTPVFVVNGAFLLVSAYAVRGGLEVVARTAQIFIPIYVFSICLLVLFLIPDYKIEYLFPMFEHGIMPSVKGATAPGSLFVQYFLITYMLPFIKDEDQTMKWSMISLGAVTLTLVVLNLVILFLFGSDLIGSLNYPVLTAARFISVAEVFEHLESLVVAIWVSGTFIKMSVQYYVTVLGLAQLFGLSDYKALVFPVGLLNALFGYWGIPNFSMVSYLIAKVLLPFSFTIYVVLPFLLLVFTIIRKRLAKAS